MTVFQIFNGEKPTGTLTVDGKEWTLESSDKELRKALEEIWEAGVEFKSDLGTKTIKRMGVDRLPASEDTIGLVEELLDAKYTLQEKEQEGEG
jgi:hypothetical protein